MWQIIHNIKRKKQLFLPLRSLGIPNLSEDGHERTEQFDVYVTAKNVDIQDKRVKNKNINSRWSHTWGIYKLNFEIGINFGPQIFVQYSLQHITKTCQLQNP